MRATPYRVKVVGFSGKGSRVGRMQQPIECGSEVGTGAWLRGPATHAILALGITQIISWGTTLYALGVLGKPIAEDTGWSQSLVFGGLTTGLLVSAAVSTLVGRGVDRRGGRGVWPWGRC